jgi:alpha-L-fucosidase
VRNLAPTRLSFSDANDVSGGRHCRRLVRIIENLRIYQPNTLVFADAALFEYGDICWAGNEDGTIPYENWNVIDRHGYLRSRPVEADTLLHKNHCGSGTRMMKPPLSQWQEHEFAEYPTIVPTREDANRGALVNTPKSVERL